MPSLTDTVHILTIKYSLNAMYIDLTTSIFEGFFLRLEVYLADPLYFCSASLISHMLANFLLTTLPSNSLFLTFGVVIHCLSYVDQKSKLPIQLKIGFPNFISGFQAVCCPTMSSSAVCLKINLSSSQNCLHVSLC